MKQMKGCEIMKALASDFDGTLYLHDAAESYREGDIAGSCRSRAVCSVFVPGVLYGVLQHFFLSDCILIFIS